MSLTITEFARFLKVFVWLTALIWLVSFIVQWHFLGAEVIAAVWRSFTLALSVAIVLFGFFSRLNWSSSQLARWMRRPTVHGVWLGALHSSYRPAGSSPLPDIPIVLVIRQTYLSLSIVSFTEKQDGESKLEAIVQDAKTDATRLHYIYELRRLYEGENKLTTGAGELKLLESGKRLKGHYWTNSPTHGDLDLKLVSRNCTEVDCFEIAARRWPSRLPAQS